MCAMSARGGASMGPGTIVMDREEHLLQLLRQRDSELEAIKEERREKDAAITFLKTRITTLQNQNRVEACVRSMGVADDACTADADIPPDRGSAGASGGSTGGTAVGTNATNAGGTGGCADRDRDRDQRIEDLERQLARTQQELQQARRSAVQRMSSASVSWELEDTKRQLADREREVENLQRSLEWQEREARSICERSAADLEELREHFFARDQEVEDLRRALERAKGTDEAEARRRERKLEEELKRQIELNQQCADQLERYAIEVDDLRSQLEDTKQQVDDLRPQHRRELDEVRAQHRRELDDVHAQHRRELDDIRSQQELPKLDVVDVTAEPEPGGRCAEDDGLILSPRSCVEDDEDARKQRDVDLNDASAAIGTDAGEDTDNGGGSAKNSAADTMILSFFDENAEDIAAKEAKRQQLAKQMEKRRQARAAAAAAAATSAAAAANAVIERTLERTRERPSASSSEPAPAYQPPVRSLSKKGSEDLVAKPSPSEAGVPPLPPQCMRSAQVIATVATTQGCAPTPPLMLTPLVAEEPAATPAVGVTPREECGAEAVSVSSPAMSGRASPPLTSRTDAGSSVASSRIPCQPSGVRVASPVSATPPTLHSKLAGLRDEMKRRRSSLTLDGSRRNVDPSEVAEAVLAEAQRNSGGPGLTPTPSKPSSAAAPPGGVSTPGAPIYAPAPAISTPVGLAWKSQGTLMVSSSAPPSPMLHHGMVAGSFPGGSSATCAAPGQAGAHGAYASSMPPTSPASPTVAAPLSPRSRAAAGGAPPPSPGTISNQAPHRVRSLPMDQVHAAAPATYSSRSAPGTADLDRSRRSFGTVRNAEAATTMPVSSGGPSSSSRSPPVAGHTHQRMSSKSGEAEQDALHDAVVRFVAQRPAARFPLVRLSRGVYLYGTKKLVVAIHNEKLMARIGGGFIALESYLVDADRAVCAPAVVAPPRRGRTSLA